MYESNFAKHEELIKIEDALMYWDQQKRHNLN